MRIIHTENVLPEINDLRTRESFLLFPKRIMDETRWLEKAIWTEKYLERIIEELSPTWVPIRWENS